ncbi:hypothetical protein [Brevundimonas sp.]|uniref:hypothetical protein n=1 Tax=Brevundimonas sp. TaxID=1871086 RepID=UPI0028A115DB|nr:hypothetical protein [Brevundimonas sp.]
MRLLKGASWVSALALLLPSGALAADPLSVLLTPKPAGNGQVAELAVELRLPAPAIEAGKPLLRMPVHIVSTPTAAYSADQISVTDDLGPLNLTSVDEDPAPEGLYRQYVAQRAPQGEMVVRYATPPRAVSAETRNGPLFDLRAQDGGLMGAGVYFMALPTVQEPYDITLNWDLSQLPEGARGVWSLGEGTRTITAPASTLSFSFYAVGQVKSEPEQGAEDFGLYWLDTPPFDIGELASETRALYQHMAKFFGDEDAPYRVFVRANPYPAGGGTALAKSFMFGYGAGGETTSGGLQMLLAHEMAHNWPRLTDAEHALTAWYTEGNAEYYSSALAYSLGQMTPEDFLKEMNERANAYYANPHIRLSNAEAGQIFWSDARAQRVPYGRGFMYLLNVNAQMREASNGTKSLDDVVLEILNRQREGKPAGLAEWIEILTREIGPHAKDEYEAMAAGEIIIPRDDSLSPCFRPHPVDILPWDLGFDEMRLGVVADLRPDSNAARAGLLEGDEILSITPMKQVRDDETKPVEMTIRRDGQVYGVSFLPRGQAIGGYRWQPVHDAARFGCLSDDGHGHAHEE